MRRIAVLGHEVEPDVLERLGLLLPAGELRQLPDQLGHLAQLRHHVADQLRPLAGRQPVALSEHLDVRPQAREWGAQLVRRVLHQLALALLGLVERAEHRVERVREGRELVGALHLDALGEVARRANALCRLAQLAERPQGRPRHQEAGERRDPDADRSHEEQPEADAGELVVDVGQLRGDLEREPRNVGCRFRQLCGEDPQVGPAPACVAEAADGPSGRHETGHRHAREQRVQTVELLGRYEFPLLSTNWNCPPNGSAEM